MDGQEFLTSNAHTAWPFDDTAEGLDRSATDTYTAGKLPVSVFADAYIEVASGDVYLSAISKGTDTYDFEFATLTGVLATITLTSAELASTYAVLTAADTAGSYTIRCVLLSSAATAYLSSMPAGRAEFALTLPFAKGAVEHAALRVLSFTLYSSEDGLSGASVGPIASDVKLVCGYNIDMFTAPVADEDRTEIGIQAAVGAGMGTVPCDDAGEGGGATSGLTGLRARSGNIQIEADDCYDIVPDAASGVFQIFGNCTACCSCDDYAAVVEALRAFGTRFRHIIDHLSHGRERYETGVTIFNEYVSNMSVGPVLNLYGMRGAELTQTVEGNFHGAPGNIRIVARLLNKTLKPLVIKRLVFKFTRPTATASIRVADVSWEYRGAGGKLAAPDVLFGTASDLTSLDSFVIALNSHMMVTLLAYVPVQVFRDDPAWSVTCTGTFVERVEGEADVTLDPIVASLELA